MPRTSPVERALSSSSFTWSSMARMSAIVRPYQRSVEQKTWLQYKWGISNTDDTGISLSLCSPMEVCEETSFGLLYKVLDSRLQTKPFEFAANQFIAGHHRIHTFSPIGANQGTTSSFLWLVAESMEEHQMLIESSNGMKFDLLTLLDLLRPYSLQPEPDRWQCRCEPPRAFSAYRALARAPEYRLEKYSSAVKDIFEQDKCKAISRTKCTIKDN